MPKLVGLVGSSSVGKTTLSHLLVGRLRTRGVLAVLSSDSGVPLPFPADFLDSKWEAWAYKIFRKLADETEHMLRANAEVVVSDRTALDLLVWLGTKCPGSDFEAALAPLVEWWTNQYSVIYHLPTSGMAYRHDGFREPVDYARGSVDTWFTARKHAKVTTVEGTVRERSEFVYHDMLFKLFGESKPKRATEQLRSWIQRVYPDWPLVEVRVIGTNSAERFHIATQEDDYDFIVVVDTSPVAAAAMSEAIQVDIPYLDTLLEARFDVKVVPVGLLPHEV